MSQTKRKVLVVGGGNAGLCAAMAALDCGSEVLLIDAAPENRSGGNTFYSNGGFRTPHTDDMFKIIPELSAVAEEIVISPYTEQDFFDDIARETQYRADGDLVQRLVSESVNTVSWLSSHGERFDLPYGRHSVVKDGKRYFTGGVIYEASEGGQGIVAHSTKEALRLGAEILYSTRLVGLKVDETGAISGARVENSRVERDIAADSVVLACGGFEANTAMRAQYLGPGWDLARPRGTEYNRGDGHVIALAVGADPVGNWSGCHATAWDLNAPFPRDRSFPHGFERQSFPFGIVVNAEGRRFVDEGANFFPYIYAKYGREILKQPGATAVQVFDSKVQSYLINDYWLRQTTKVESDSLNSLADSLEVDRGGFLETVAKFNASIESESNGANEFDPGIKDGLHTSGLEPNKSNWALPIDTPPFFAFPVTCGITFTFGGIHIDTNACVLDRNGQPIPGLFAAGEMVGGIYLHNYVGGTGLVTGAVFGRLAGAAAAGELSL